MLNNFESYILGFIQTDGSSKTSRFQIEISVKDENILHKINDYLDNQAHISTRTRDTNFKDNYVSVTLSFNKSLIEKIKDFVPVGKKSAIIEAPKNIEYSKKDYWRGIIDGDGSLGFKKTKESFISLVTDSENLYKNIKLYLKDEFDISINLHRNKRDNIYNIVLLGPRAYIFTKQLYENAPIVLNRKAVLAEKIITYDYQNFTKGSYNFSKNEDDIIYTKQKEEILSLITTVDWNRIAARRKYLKTLNKYYIYK